MAENNYVTVTTRDQIEENKVNCFRVEDVPIAICKVKDDYFAVHNKCSHADAYLTSGRLRGHKLLCPLHGAIFDVRDGAVLSPPARQPIKSYELKVEGEEIKIKLSD